MGATRAAREDNLSALFTLANQTVASVQGEICGGKGVHHARAMLHPSRIGFDVRNGSALKVKVNSIYEFYLVLWDIFQQSTELSDAVTDAS